MKPEARYEFEKIFRSSNSSDELFDAFRSALEAKIKDVELFKTFLSNKALSSDEIIMFAEKICKEYPDLSFKIYYWVGQIFSSISSYGKHHENAFKYFQKSASVNKASHEPYVAISKIYIKELNEPRFEKVEKELIRGIDFVILKSKVCFALSNLYKKIGMKEKEKKYQKLGEKYQKEGH